MHLLDNLSRRSRDYKDTFGSEAGKRVLADLLKFTQYTTHAFTPGDPNTTSWVLGKQVVAKRILGFMHLTDEEVNSIIKTKSNTSEDSIPWGN